MKELVYDILKPPEEIMRELVRAVPRWKERIYTKSWDGYESLPQMVELENSLETYINTHKVKEEGGLVR